MQCAVLQKVDRCAVCGFTNPFRNGVWEVASDPNSAFCFRCFCSTQDCEIQRTITVGVRQLQVCLLKPTAPSTQHRSACQHKMIIMEDCRLERTMNGLLPGTVHSISVLEHQVQYHRPRWPHCFDHGYFRLPQLWILSLML